MDQQGAQDPTQAVADAGAVPSTEAQETENNAIDRLIRGVGRIFGGGRSSGEPAEDAALDESTEQGGAAEPAWTPPQTRDEFDRAIQSEVDRRQAKWQREQQQRDASQRSQAEWARIKTLAENGDTWALGEIAQEEVRQRAAQEQTEAAYGEFLKTHVPLFDKSYLDPMLADLPEEAWRPIVGEGLTTLEERAAAVPKILAAHRQRAVADALTDESFVRKLLSAQSFRLAWQKSPAVREQFMATLRGDVPEPDAPAGVARGARPKDEESEMDAMIRGQRGALRATLADRQRSARFQDL